jgi:limonene-1,2-epoxide hydrolase
MREENIAAVEKYLNALQAKDLSNAPLADELEFEDSVAGKGRGAENLKAFLSGFLPAINAVKIIQHICENDMVVTHWEADTVFGIIPILEKFRVRDGKIIEAIRYFDPRPVLG